MNKNKITIGLIVAMMAFIIGCEREIDAPPGHELGFGDVISIDSLRALHDSQSSYTFTEEVSIYGVATTDETSGNFYREFYMQDETTGTGLHVSLQDPGGIVAGDRVRIRLQGATLAAPFELLQLEDVSIDTNVFIQANGVNIEPVEINLSSALGYYEQFESRLVTIQDVQLVDDEICETFANGATLTSFNRTVEDCNGNSIILRNSGFANFADQIMPTGMGTFTGILGKYNDDWQLYVRNPSELAMTGNRCNGDTPVDCGSFYLSEGFSDGTIDPWTSVQVQGVFQWETSSLGGSPNVPYANFSNYDGSQNIPADSWLVSPTLDLSGATAPYLSFISAMGYFGDPIEVYVSTDYDGNGVIDMGDWVQLNPTVATNDVFWTWTESGEVDLTPYISSNVHIAFRYVGTGADQDGGATWEIDNVIVTEL